MMPIFLLLLLSFATYGKSGWIDPFSIDTELDPAMKELISSKCDGNYALVLSHYKRYINMLLRDLRHDVESNSYQGKINVELPAESYEFLRDFSMGKALETDWREVDSIISGLFYKSAREKLNDFVLTWRDRFVLVVYSHEFKFAVLAIVATIFIYKVSKTKFTFKDIVKFLAVFIYIIDFGFTYIRLLKEKEVENIADSMKFSTAPECDPKKMSPMQYLSYLTSTTDKCQHYYKLQYVDILWVVNPLKVIGNQFNDLIVTPANGLGTAFGQFTNALVGNMSWYLAPMLPVLLFFILLMFCILLSFVTRTSFGFNFFYLINFSFGKEQRQKIDAISGDNLSKLLKAIKRPQIQEIKFVKDEGKLETVGKCESKAAGDGIIPIEARKEEGGGKKETEGSLDDSVFSKSLDDSKLSGGDCSLDDSKLLEDCKA